MAKYKVVTINGVRMAVALRREQGRPAVPSPVRCYSGGKEYSRPREKEFMRKTLYEEVVKWI